MFGIEALNEADFFINRIFSKKDVNILQKENACSYGWWFLDESFYMEIWEKELTIKKETMGRVFKYALALQ